MGLRNKQDRYIIDEEDIVMDEGLQNPNQTKNAREELGELNNWLTSFGSTCLPPEITDDIIVLMEDYAKYKSEKYAKHYFNTRTKVKHPLGIHEYDLWDKLNNK